MQVPTLADVAAGAAARGISVDQMLRHAMRFDVAGTVGGGGRAHVRGQPAPSQSSTARAWASQGGSLRPGNRHQLRGADMSSVTTTDERKARRLAKRLCQAARNGNATQLSALLDEGAPVDMPGFGGNTPLMVAAWNDRADCVALLLERGAAVDLGEPDYGYTPLLLAAQYGALSAAQLLVMAGADLHCRLTGGPDTGLTARAVAHNGRARVYADPQPGREVRASHSRDAQVGRGRIDSQHSSVAQLLSCAERQRVGARQRLAFASLFLEEEKAARTRSSGGGASASASAARGGGLAQLLPRSADGGCDLLFSGGGEAGSVIWYLRGIALSQRVVDATLSEPHSSTVDAQRPVRTV